MTDESDPTLKPLPEATEATAASPFAGIRPTAAAPEGPEHINDVPVRVVNSYSRLWQFETWLRTMVYVELRGKLGDEWARDLKTKDGHQAADKSLTHMPTAEENNLSYSQLSDLLDLISAHWDCFATYFPPHDLWQAKLKEVKQIRNRVAHFRAGHTDDHPRLLQFLRDVDQGFWRFCTSYNDAHTFLPPKSNPVAKYFLPLDPLPFVEVEKKTWAQVGFRNTDLPVGVTIGFQKRPWATTLDVKNGGPGMLYDVRLFAQDRRSFDLGDLLTRTRGQHLHLVHILLGSCADDLRLTIPSILGTRRIVSIIETFHRAALNAVRREREPDAKTVQSLADQWPEYVIGPQSPLSFLSPEMPCSIFGV